MSTLKIKILRKEVLNVNDNLLERRNRTENYKALSSNRTTEKS